jgi:thiamine-monophosphate kinase
VHSEFELIDRWFKRMSSRADVLLGVGDDAALLQVPPGRQLAVTVDTLVAGVHFPHETDAVSIGHKSLAVNLSDLAAMGAEPAWVTLALTLPQADEDWLAGFSHGFLELAEACGVSLVGGDTTRGPLSITVQASGFVPDGLALRRSGARPGDALCVTGSLGDAGLGLAWLLGERTLPPKVGQAVRERLDRPAPRVAAGLALRGLASAAIDVSDGLAADLRHILQASGVGATVDVDALPLSEPVRTQSDARELALASGDDYELLFAVAPADEQETVARLQAQGLRCTRIGRVEVEPGLRLTNADGSPYAAATPRGYDHFQESD